MNASAVASRRSICSRDLGLLEVEDDGALAAVVHLERRHGRLRADRRSPRRRRRCGSPSGGSTLITSAPQSASRPAAAGPATHTPSSTTRNPSSGPVIAAGDPVGARSRLAASLGRARIVASASLSLMNSAANAAMKANSTATPKAMWKPSAPGRSPPGRRRPEDWSSRMCDVRMLARMATPSDTPIWRWVEKIELARPVSAGEMVA